MIGSKAPSLDQSSSPAANQGNQFVFHAVLLAAGFADIPTDPKPGDAMIAEFFEIETNRITSRNLANIESKEDWEKVRDGYRRQLFEMLGLSPLPARSPLEAKITGTTEFEDIIVENVVFESRPGLYVTGDPGGVDENAKIGMLGIRIGLGWAKSHTFATGQCPVMRYHRQLMQAILYDKIDIAKAVNVQTITLDDAPNGYKDFDKGAATKFVLDPHGMVA